MGRTKKKVTKIKVRPTKSRATAQEMQKRLAAMSPAERQKHELRLVYNRWKDELGKIGQWKNRDSVRSQELLRRMQKDALNKLGVTVTDAETPAPKPAVLTISREGQEFIQEVVEKNRAAHAKKIGPAKRLSEIATELERLDVARETLAEEAAKIAERLVSSYGSKVEGGAA